MAQYVLTENEKIIVDNVSIPQYYNDFIVPKKPGFRKISAERPSGICPFHSDTDPSFHFWKEKKAYHCFGCHASGNVISMHIRWQQIEYKRFVDKNTAIREIANAYGIELVLDESGDVKTESVFDVAKRKTASAQYENNGMDGDKMSIVKFRTFNNQVKNTISKSPYIDGETAARQYHKLDLTLSGYLAEVKGASRSDG